METEIQPRRACGFMNGPFEDSRVSTRDRIPRQVDMKESCCANREGGQGGVECKKTCNTGGAEWQSISKQQLSEHCQVCARPAA